MHGSQVPAREEVHSPGSEVRQYIFELKIPDKNWRFWANFSIVVYKGK